MIKFESCWALRRTKTHFILSTYRDVRESESAKSWQRSSSRSRYICWKWFNCKCLEFGRQVAISGNGEFSKKIGSVIEAAGANSMSPESTLEKIRGSREIYFVMI
jgi:hypothetical protein